MTAIVNDDIIEPYVRWLREGLSVSAANGATELTTPFLDRHNDHLQVYVLADGGKITLTDEGYILGDLAASGLEMNTPKRKEVLQAALSGVGVRNDGGRLTVEASRSNVGQKLHSLIQAMLAVNDMFVMAQSRVASVFWEDVRAFLQERDIRFSERIKITGRSGYDTAIDFIIPHSRQRPERLVQAINAPAKDSIASFLFALTDTRDARGADTEAYAFLNDEGRVVGGDVVDALRSYEVITAFWTRRAELANSLVN